jgi:Uma2 family endonuclease
MSAANRPHYSIDEYVRLEDHANVKHEYFDGQIWAMAGGTPEHAAIASAIIASLVVQLRGKPCRVHTSDARVRVAATGLDTYPDVTVVCGHLELDPEDKNAIANPTLLVEVTSDSSEAYDRGGKLDHYRRIPSLREVVIVSHRERRIEVVRRGEGDDWTTRTSTEGAVALASLGCTLEVEDLYADPLAART